MTHRSLLLVVLLASATSAFSQEFISFAVRGGANLSSNSGEGATSFNQGATVSQSAKVNFNLGVAAMKPINHWMAIQAELFYSGEGFKQSVAYEGLTDYDQKLNFLNLPVLFKYTFAGNFYAMAGPQFSYLLSAKRDIKMYDSPGHIYDERSDDVTHQMKRLTIGITPALGYDLKKFSFSVRYYAGLSQLVKPDYSGDVKSQVFSAVVSYKVFSLNK